MKTQFKLQIILGIFFFISNNIFSQDIINTQNNISSHEFYLWDINSIEDDGWWSKDFIIKVTPNTPVKLTYSMETNNYFTVFTNENGIWKTYVDISEYTPSPVSITIISTSGEIHLSFVYGYNDNYDDLICSFSTSTDQNYPVNSTTTLFQKDNYFTGNVGIGTVLPREKLDVIGSVRIDNKLIIGNAPSTQYTNSKSVIYNTTDDISQRIYSYKSSTGITYGLNSLADNPLGTVYGIYSEVNGLNGKKWAGYFKGGDVAVMNGNVGIGTPTPKSQLHVGGSTMSTLSLGSVSYTGNTGQALAAIQTLQGNSNGGILNFQVNPWNQTGYAGVYTPVTRMTIDQYGNVGIGTTTPNAKLDITGNSHVNVPSSSNPIDAMTIDVQSFNTHENAKLSNYFRVRDIGAGNSIPFLIRGDGFVGIGTSNPDEMLTVNGTIHAKEVLVDINIPADYVFKPTYKLMPLNEVEQFVNKNSHLPEIPSAAEIKKNGMSMGEMQNKLLQKVEELTLYVIEQEKNKNALEAKLTKQENQFKALLEKIEILTAQNEEKKGLDKK